jgi:hypothetical protein
MLVFLVALPLVGVIATIDDDLPGGFSNPKGTTPGPWRDWENWADIGCRGAISGIGFSMDAGIWSISGVALLLLGLAGIAGAIKVHRIIDSKVLAMTPNKSLERTREG